MATSLNGLYGGKINNFENLDGDSTATINTYTGPETGRNSILKKISMNDIINSNDSICIFALGPNANSFPVECINFQGRIKNNKNTVLGNSYIVYPQSSDRNIERGYLDKITFSIVYQFSIIDKNNNEIMTDTYFNTFTEAIYQIFLNNLKINNSIYIYQNVIKENYDTKDIIICNNLYKHKYTISNTYVNNNTYVLSLVCNLDNSVITIETPIPENYGFIY